MPRKDKVITPSVTNKLQSLGYNVADWDDSKTNITSEIKTVLSTASKRNNGKEGYPDRIFCDTEKKLLILVEEKPAMKDHNINDVELGAVEGIKWYISRFLGKNLKSESLVNYFKTWKIVGIAVSGDLSDDYKFLFNCFLIDRNNDVIVPANQITNFVSEDEFISVFNNLDEEKAIASVSSSSKKINKLLRSIDSQKRPILLSALMICLHSSYGNDFGEHYNSYSADILADNVILVSDKVLEKEGIPSEKRDILKNELQFLKSDQILRNSDILKQILDELKQSVIPLFNNGFSSNSNYDIIGKFYEDFLTYAGVSNVKKGIVLTPRHITSLFTKLVDIKEDDKIVDLCCGTGALLIAGLNAIIDRIQRSDRNDKSEAIKKVKQNQLLGFETNPTMYICAISNMLFRGDGKSSIHNYDSINDSRAQIELDKFKPTIGFINPPYSGKENQEDPTPKEITFMTKLVDNCSRYCVVIAPLSVYFKDKQIRNNILKKHTLKMVINMPKDLFQPNASTYTAVSVFETNRAFDYENDEVIFYDLRDDGFALAKSKGRTDIYNRWNKIEKELLNAVKYNKVEPNGITFVKTKIKKGDEWSIYAHSKTDYSTLCEQDFIDTIGDYMLFNAKFDLGIIESDKSEYEMLNILSSYYGDNDE